MQSILKTLTGALAVSALCATAASASSIVFEGQNAALFPGANPSDTAALMNSVNRPKDPSAAAAAAGGISPSALIEQSVESQISTAINNQIFNNSNASGSFDLGGGNLISYVRTGGNIVISLTDPVHGTTIITVPDI